MKWDRCLGKPGPLGHLALLALLPSDLFCWVDYTLSSVFYLTIYLKKDKMKIKKVASETKNTQEKIGDYIKSLHI